MAKQIISEADLADYDELLMAIEPKSKQETSEAMLADLDELLQEV